MSALPPAVIGLGVGTVFLGSLLAIFKCLTKEEEPVKQHIDKGAEKAAVLGRMIRELIAYETRKAEPEVEEAEADIETIEVFIDQMLREKPIRFSSQQLTVFTWNYSTKLGSGAFGEVYKGEFPNGVQVAVKVLNNNYIDKRVEEQFMAEVSTIGRANHRNLVRLYGFCFDAKAKALVYEYMENGSLDKVLFSKKHIIEWEKLYEIAIGAAKGLEYLHHYSQKRIIHCDIKPDNVLLSSDFCPKLADFGLAKLCNKDSSLVTISGARGTPGYAAPELWMPFPVTIKCDVYGFGMMLFEIIGRRRNLDIGLTESQHWFPKQVWTKFDKGELEEIIVESGIEEKDMEKAKTMSMVALWCVQYLPDARPSMSSVVKVLEGGAQVMAPPNPFQHLVSSSGADQLPFCVGSSSYSTTDSEIIDYQNHTPIKHETV